LTLSRCHRTGAGRILDQGDFLHSQVVKHIGQETVGVRSGRVIDFARNSLKSSNLIREAESWN
jgi:hypothetical protein